MDITSYKIFHGIDIYTKAIERIQRYDLKQAWELLLRFSLEIYVQIFHNVLLSRFIFESKNCVFLKQQNFLLSTSFFSVMTNNISNFIRTYITAFCFRMHFFGSNNENYFQYNTIDSFKS